MTINKRALRRMTPEALQSVADNIREFLVQSISDTGGHLASNLGVVELTVALHAVFDTPRDSIIWDVGHQAYVHKILTGRGGLFGDLRKMDGLSGFPKPSESEHDAFGTGHSSTAISAALGLAVARDIRARLGINAGDGATGSGYDAGSSVAGSLSTSNNARRERIVAVVGDGSMTGGLAYEGLNNAGRANTDLLVILNDNQMSISRNVGAVAQHLNVLRTSRAYVGAKADVRNLLKKMPLVGKPIVHGIESVKNALRHAVLPGVLFEEMGFRYVGLVDGHDIAALLPILRQVRRLRGPVLLHVSTTKGKGYKSAEKSPGSYHGVGKFNIETGRPAAPAADANKLTYTQIFSKEICRRASLNEKIVAITAAMTDGVGLSRFKQCFPRRFFDVGIAEAHAITFAAGLAKGGLRPVVAVYSSFLQRGYDQIIHDVAIQNLPVIFAIDHAGAVPNDGETHQGIYDIAFLSHIPNMVILAPSCAEDIGEMLDFALAHNGPVAIRYPKGFAANRGGEIQKGLQNSEKIAIVSVGAMLQTATTVAERVGAEVIEAKFVKPIYDDLIARLRDFDYVFTLEDGAKSGGFGEGLHSRIAALNCRKMRQIYFKAFAFPDIFPETGTREELFARYELDADSIYKKISKEIGHGQQKET